MTRFTSTIAALGLVLGLAVPAAAGTPQLTFTGGQAPPSYSPEAPLVLLYDQTSNPGVDYITSQNFEAAFDAYDAEAADDFIVPAGDAWTVNQVFISGVHATGPIDSVNIRFYADAAGLPGALEYTAMGVVPTSGGASPVLDLTTPAVLSPGKHWLSAQVNMNFGAGGQWFWTDRIVVSNSGAAWQNPGGGFGAGCTSWGTRGATCAIGAAEPDQIFSLSGTVGVPASADLSISKTDDVDPIGVGQTLTYTVTVTNGGPSDATNVVVTDNLPTGTTFVSAIPSQGTCTQAGGVVCNLGTIPASGAPIMYGGVGNGSGLNPGALISVNESTGAGAFIGDPVTPGGLTGIAISAAGTLYGSTIQGGGSTSSLVTIDRATGALIATIGPITDGVNPMSVGDLAFQPGTGVLYALRSNSDPSGLGGRLYTVNLATGAGTLIGDTLTGAGGGIAFTPAGVLYQTSYSASGGFTSLNTINPADASRIATVATPRYFGGLAVRADGVIFATPGGSSTDQVYTIDPATGTETFVGNTGGWEASDLAFGAGAGTATITIVVTTPGTAGTITNTASVSASESDPNMANNSDSEDTLVVDPCAGETVDPVVTPPAPITIDASTCVGNQEGATGATNAALAAYLAGGSATDNCDATPTALAPQVAGSDVNNSTFFPLGTTTVTFRFQDDAGNIGTATSTVTVELFYGDLNQDGQIDAVDLVTLANYLVGNVAQGTPPFTAPLAAADVNRSGGVDASDLVILANHLVGNIACLPT